MKSTRNTTAKTAVLELITNSDVALSHIEIQKTIGDLCDRVTIYRILSRLLTDDLIHKIATPDGTVKYAACNHQHHDQKKHIHNLYLNGPMKCNTYKQHKFNTVCYAGYIECIIQRSQFNY